MARVVAIGRNDELRDAGDRITFGGPVALTAVAGGVVAVWGEWESVMMSPLPLTENSATAVAFGAAEQTLITTASSYDATVVVWSEWNNGRETVHLGVRGNDGSWTEQVRTDVRPFAAAATDGREFLLVYPITPHERYARRFDASGRPLAPAARVDLPFHITDLAWNGQQYVAVGVSPRTGDILAAFLSANGTASAPVIVHRSPGYGAYLGAPVVATNGSSHFVAWRNEQMHYFPPFGSTYSIHGVSVGADLSPGKTVSFGYAADESAPGVAWDGAGFVVAWVDDNNDPTGIRVSPAGVAGPPLRMNAQGPALAPIHVASIAGGVALAWRGIDSTVRMATLLNGSDYISTQPGVLTYAAGAPRAVSVSGGAAVIAAAVVDAAPWHGSRRLMMTIARATQPKPTTAPAVTVQLHDGRLHVEWTALKESVTGYRVEYRIGEGNWNEIERSPDPNVRTATFKPPRGGNINKVAFRVRATSEGGTGPYSAQATIFLGKRRAVR